MAKSALELLQEYRSIVENANRIFKGSWIPRHDEAQLTWKDRRGIYLVLPGSNSAYGNNDGGFGSVEEAERFNNENLAGKWRVKVNGELPQHGKFNTCSECDGEGCSACDYTGNFATGMDANHYD